MPRLFVAIDLPRDLKLKLSLLCAGVPRARLVDPENFHLTLRFIGEVNDSATNAIAAALMRVEAPRFALTLAGAGHFGRRTLWVGVEQCPALMYLQREIESALQGAGLTPDAERYFPHIKLARLRSRSGQTLRTFLNENGLFRAEAFAIERFTLMESHLIKGGAVYAHRADYALH